MDEQPDSTSREDFGIDPRERDHADMLQKRIAGARKLDRDYLKMVKRNRLYAEGLKIERGTEKNLDLFRTEETPDADVMEINLLHSTFKVLMPPLAAKNPECAMSPTEAVDDAYLEFMRRHARTGEIYNNWSVRQGRFKSKLRRMVLSALTVGEGWIKVVYQRDYDEDPLIRHRIDDAQDNLRQLERLVSQTDPDHDPGMTAEELNAKMAELQETIARLQEQVEVVRAEGFVFANTMTDDIVLDPSINQVDDYLDSEWITEQIWVPWNEAIEITGFREGDDYERLKHAQRYTGRGCNDPDSEEEIKHTGGHVQESNPEDPETNCLLLFQETWHRGDRTVYTTIKGMPGYAKRPFSPRKVSKRWYPHFMLQFNDVEGRRRGLSEVELLDQLQDEYNENRTHLRTHRQRAIPAMIGRRGHWSDEDAKRFNARETAELLLIEGPDDESVPINASYTVAPYPPIDPALYDTTQTRLDIDNLSGVPDARQASLVGDDKTATEAAIMQEGFSSRTQDRVDMVETVITDVFQHMYELALQEVSFEQISRIAGPQSVWPGGGVLANVELTHHDLEEWIQVEVRAGSTGKPNKQLEQQNWLQLFPLLQQSVMQIQQARMQTPPGMPNPMADALEAMLKEFIRRFDERIDIEMFLGGGDARANQIPQQVQAFMAARGIQPAMPGMPMPGAGMGGAFMQPAQTGQMPPIMGGGGMGMAPPPPPSQQVGGDQSGQ